MPNADPIGKRITQVDGHELEVVGVMDRPAASLPGQDDTRILIPYFTMRKMFPNVQRAHADRDRLSRHDGSGAGRSPRRAADCAARAVQWRRTPSPLPRPSR